MTTWAFLSICVSLPQPKRSELIACIEMAGWRPLDGFADCWYGCCGELNQREVVLAVRGILETALITVDSDAEVCFALHTGQSTPHVGKVKRAKTRRVRKTTRQVEGPAYRRTRPCRIPHPMHTKRQTRSQG
ncbi:MAG: hypothetical protein M5U25_16350 [Planctomycetota bacterium]|nr:hypothetical protein [Planctomycetota bacterium]